MVEDTKALVMKSMECSKRRTSNGHLDDGSYKESVTDLDDFRHVNWS